MNRAQKTAWFILIAISSGVVVSTIAVGVLALNVGMPKAFAGLGFMGLTGIGGLAPLIFKKDTTKVTCDERDKLINRRAALASFGLSYLFVGLACMIPFFILGPTASISIIWLPMIFGGAGIVAFFVHSTAILVQHGWRDRENE